MQDHGGREGYIKFMQVIKHHPPVNYDPFLDWKNSWGHLSLYQVETMHQAGTSNNFSIACLIHTGFRWM